MAAWLTAHVCAHICICTSMQKDVAAFPLPRQQLPHPLHRPLHAPPCPLLLCVAPKLQHENEQIVKIIEKNYKAAAECASERVYEREREGDSERVHVRQTEREVERARGRASESGSHNAQREQQIKNVA